MPDPSESIECDPEIEAEIEKTRIWSQFLKDLLTSPNAGKLIEAWASIRDSSGKHASDSNAKIAELQARHLYRSNFFFIVALVVCLAFLAWVIYFLRGDKDTLLPVLSAVISLIAGAGGGYVFGRRNVTGRSES